MKDECERKIEEFHLEFSEKKGFGRKRNPKFYTILYDWADSVVGAILLIFIIFAFFFRVVGVSGTSMVPTLSDGDWVAVSSINGHARRGDIVVVTQPNDVHEPLIKRVIAIGGDRLDIDLEKNTVSINGHQLKEPYIKEPINKSFGVDLPLTVPEGYVFVMGDNRNNSKDSRSPGVGMIDERYILGRTLFRFYPFKDSKIKYATFDLKKQVQGEVI
ncbi:MAG: signal peptidase I [Clostridiales bacterium]|nr:signal peptidase I [Clostridiales bacterium]